MRPEAHPASHSQVYSPALCLAYADKRWEDAQHLLNIGMCPNYRSRACGPWYPLHYAVWHCATPEDERRGYSTAKTVEWLLEKNADPDIPTLLSDKGFEKGSKVCGPPQTRRTCRAACLSAMHRSATRCAGAAGSAAMGPAGPGRAPVRQGLRVSSTGTGSMGRTGPRRAQTWRAPCTGPTAGAWQGD